MRFGQKHERSTPPELPVATYEVQRAYRRTWNTLGIFQVLIQVTIGVFRPGPDDPKTWHGRVLRFIGLLCVYAVIATAIAIAIQNILRGKG